jgi:hypothetical protein
VLGGIDVGKHSSQHARASMEASVLNSRRRRQQRSYYAIFQLLKFQQDITSISSLDKQLTGFEVKGDEHEEGKFSGSDGELDGAGG